MARSPVHEAGAAMAVEAQADGGVSGWVGRAGIVALVGIVLALIGAFGTDAMPFGWRLLYWIGGLLAGLAVLEILTIVTRHSAALAGLPPVAAYLLAVPFLAGLIVLMLGLSDRGMEAATPALFLQSAGLGAAIFALFFVLNLRKPDRAEEQSSVPPFSNTAHAGDLTDTALHARLPADFGPIFALGIEDHYTIVHGAGTDGARSEMLLIALGDAIAEVGETQGLRVHRSWWVAHSAVQRATQEGRNVVLELAGGLRVPVSRANVAPVREAGWL